MRCDVLAVGTELLLGQIVDTNSAWIGEQLARSGIDSLTQVKVGDNVGRIEAVLRRLLADADAVIVCGGLGPTHDDVTREAIAAVMGVGLREDPAVAAVIRDLFASRGRTMPENNLRQAQVPEGADVIPQTRGTAPGLICPIGDKVVYAVPGRAPRDARDARAGGAARPARPQPGAGRDRQPGAAHVGRERERPQRAPRRCRRPARRVPAIRRWRSSPEDGTGSRSA